MVDRFVQVDQRRQHLIRCFVPCPDCPSWSKDLRSMSISNGRSGRLSEIIMEVENHQFLVDNGHPKSGAMPFIRWPMIMSKQCKRHKNFTRTLKAIACASKERSLLQKPTEGPMTSPFLEEPVGESEKEPRLRTPQALGRVSPSLRPRSAGTQSREHWVHWHLVLPLPRFFPLCPYWTMFSAQELRLQQGGWWGWLAPPWLGRCVVGYVKWHLAPSESRPARGQTRTGPIGARESSLLKYTFRVARWWPGGGHW